MSDRIRNLEDALAILQATVAPGEPHPLLGRDLLRIKSSIELHSAVDADELGVGSGTNVSNLSVPSGSGPSASVNGKADANPAFEKAGEEAEEEQDESHLIDAFGTLAIRDDGGTVFYGRSAGSESLLIGESAPSPPSPTLMNFNTSLSATTILGSANPLRSQSTLNHAHAHAHARVLSRPTLSAPLNNNGHAKPTANPASKEDSWNSDLPSAIHHLATAFPFPSTSASLQNLSSLAGHGHTHAGSSAGGPASTSRVHKIDLDHLVQTYLPPWQEADKMAALFLQHAAWCFGAVVERRQLEEEVLPLWYPEAKYKIELDEQKLSNGFGGTGATHGDSAGAAPKSPSDSAATASEEKSSTAALSRSKSTVALDTLTLTPLKPKPTAHDLALLFAVFCCASALDVEGETSAPASFFSSSTSTNTHAHTNAQNGAAKAGDSARRSAHWYTLAKATLGMEPILERAPVVATVQTLALMSVYEGLSEGQVVGGGPEEAEGGGGRGGCTERGWVLVGLACKLAQSLGLHRDSARWKLPPAEVQKRRSLFWELYVMDGWQSLATGRLPTFSLPFVDCELPADTEQTLGVDGSVQHSLHHWKASFGHECISQVVQGTLTSRAPKYSLVLELDRKIRETEVPDVSQAITQGQNMGLAETMKCFMPTNYRDLTLLYIHRCFFAHAITAHSLDPIKSQYAPSFLAGYRTACTIIGSVKQQFVLYPAQIAKFWVLWTHAFSASVMLASVVTHASQSKVAPTALLELRTAVELFEKAASYGGRAVKFLPILQRLQHKAQQTYLESNSGIPPTLSMTELFKPTSSSHLNASSNNSQDPERDELSIFSGRTHTIIAPASPTQPSPLLSSPGSGFGLGSNLRGRVLSRVNSPLGQSIHSSLSSSSSSSSSIAGDGEFSNSPVSRSQSQPQPHQVIQPQQPHQHQSLTQVLSQAQSFVVSSSAPAQSQQQQQQSSLSRSPSQTHVQGQGLGGLRQAHSGSRAQLQSQPQSQSQSQQNKLTGSSSSQNVSLSQLITSSTPYIVDSGSANVHVGTVGLVGLDDVMDTDMEVDVSLGLRNGGSASGGGVGGGGQARISAGRTSSNPLLSTLGRSVRVVESSDGGQGQGSSVRSDVDEAQRRQQQQKSQWQQMQEHMARQEAEAEAERQRAEQQRQQEAERQILEQQQKNLERQRAEQQQQQEAERQKLEQQQMMEREKLDMERQRLEQQHQQQQSLFRHQSMGNLAQFAQEQQQQFQKPVPNQGESPAPSPLNQSQFNQPNHANLTRHHSSGNIHYSQDQHSMPPPPTTRIVQAQPITLPRHHSSSSLQQYAQEHQHLQVPQFQQHQQVPQPPQVSLPRHHSSGNLRYFGQLESTIDNQHHGPMRRQSMGNLQHTAQQQASPQAIQTMAQPFEVPRSQSSFQFNDYQQQPQQVQQQQMQNQDVGNPNLSRHNSTGNLQQFTQEFQQQQPPPPPHSAPAHPFHIPRHRSSGNLQFYAQEQQGQQQSPTLFAHQSQGAPLQSIPEDSDGSVQQPGRSTNLPHSATYPNLQQHFQQQIRQQQQQQQPQPMQGLSNNGFMQMQHQQHQPTMVIDPNKPPASFSALHYHSTQSPTIQSPTNFGQPSPLEYHQPQSMWTSTGMIIESSIKHPSQSPDQSPSLHSMAQYQDAASDYQIQRNEMFAAGLDDSMGGISTGNGDIGMEGGSWGTYMPNVPSDHQHISSSVHYTSS
ncbi:hypothetical protein AX16_010513 [Volvariella volvacea WC 439]|nr:hypothetical protein AX16_010513 [Volvariella volvacea WC 439]